MTKKCEIAKNFKMYLGNKQDTLGKICNFGKFFYKTNL
jgi:hypothetical protein